MDSSVIVPRLGDAAARACGETRIFLNGLCLAALSRSTEEGRFDGLDFVAITVDVLDSGDGVA